MSARPRACCARLTGPAPPADVKRFRFGLQTPSTVLGLPIGQHISLKYIDAEGKDVLRSYTPVSSNGKAVPAGACLAGTHVAAASQTKSASSTLS